MTAPVGSAPVSTPLVARSVLISAAATGVCAVWAAAVWAAVHLRADPLLHDVALFVHLACLIVGFGAVLTVDWLGLLWLLGKRPLPDVLRTADAVHVPIWLGLAGLVGSGVLLHPDPGAPLTRIKLGLVLLVALNGLHARTLQPRLTALVAGARSPSGVSRRALVARCAAGVLVSQLGWWGAIVIGFLNSRR
ncbi:hypothetical protein [Streptomyces hesseae]|uniref:Copper resistance protein D domain-containing protein n=1 Tax=Streptomyces hesseae TaxID=3075519 RepID=A0ABU2STX7_9ACTN|nr:hypothetical protein [Streptomyces sp. DSM 40473]MDT0452317.1 hypothetical protein [Streptomyces sp. DSM 40473]